jgi:hypothetical protein
MIVQLFVKSAGKEVVIEDNSKKSFGCFSLRIGRNRNQSKKLH